uniref:F-box protein At5g07610-like n=1 Tax=Erigeron canadensis TaxID=72917 RepID=UPI001CB8AAA1|nr:F-box protein At5g07610-like [Erigeron canadensis]
MAEGGNYKIRVSSSKRLMTDDDASPCVHQVLFNDDLLIEILLRLPLVSLFLLKSVSKRWLSLITSPVFFNLRVIQFPNIQPLSGLFLHKTISTNDHFQHDFVSLDSSIPAGSNVEVKHSCNGLILCVTQTNPGKVYVYNSSHNMFKMLPPIYADALKSDRMRLAYEPTKSPHYRILHFRWINPRSLERQIYIQTWVYSSETGSWKFGYNFPERYFRRNFDSGVYWNDAIHWLDNKNRVLHFNLDVEHPRSRTTQLPNTLDKFISHQELFHSRGCLLVACAVNNPHPKHLKIYKIKDGYSGWSVKYIVKYEDTGIAAFLKTWNMSNVRFSFNVLCIVMGEKEEESFFVMNLKGKVVKYNLLSKTLHMLCDIDRQLIKFRTFPFIASFA